MLGVSLSGLLAAAAVQQNPGGIKRVTSDSVTGRRMAQAKGAHIADDSHIPPNIREHNAAIDAKRAAKKARKHVISQ
jgi:hypothetical protein